MYKFDFQQSIRLIISAVSYEVHVSEKRHEEGEDRGRGGGEEEIKKITITSVSLSV